MRDRRFPPPWSVESYLRSSDVSRRRLKPVWKIDARRVLWRNPRSEDCAKHERDHKHNPQRRQRIVASEAG